MGFGNNEASGSFFQPIPNSSNQSPLLSAADLMAVKVGYDAVLPAMISHPSILNQPTLINCEQSCFFPMY